jgi:SAM-dependent methyltransferase
MLEGEGGDGRGAERALLRCPRCHGTLAGAGYRCGKCGARWPVDEVAVTLLDGEVVPYSLGARAMQSDWLAEIYERWWRPVLFQASSGGRLPGFDREVQLVLDRLGHVDGPWLDLSCGPGNLLQRLHAAVPRGSVVGLDLSRSMLKRARRRVPSALLVRANAEALPLVSGRFGAVINLAALDLYSDAGRVVAESARVLAPGGRWIASSFLSPDFIARRRTVRRWVAQTTGVYPVTRGHLQEWVEAAGLEHYDELRLGKYVLVWADKPTTAEKAA